MKPTSSHKKSQRATLDQARHKESNKNDEAESKYRKRKDPDDIEN